LGAEGEGLGTPSWDDYFFAGLIPRMRSSERLPSGVMAYIGAGYTYYWCVDSGVVYAVKCVDCGGVEEAVNASGCRGLREVVECFRAPRLDMCTERAARAVARFSSGRATSIRIDYAASTTIADLKRIAIEFGLA